MAENWFQPIQRELFCGKQLQPIRQEIGSNQYSGKLVQTNTAGKAEQRGIGSNQYGGKLVKLVILHEIVPTNTSGVSFDSKLLEQGNHGRQSR